MENYFFIFPDWGSSIQYEYGFSTSIAGMIHLGEQRRPLAEASALSASATYKVRKKKAQTVFHELQYLKDKFIAIPIHIETIHIASIDGIVIHPTINLEDCYHLKNRYRRYVFLVDSDGEFIFRTVKDVVFERNFLEVEDIPAGFTPTIIYPVFIAYIKAMSKTDETDDFDIWKIDFQGIRQKISRLKLSTPLYPLYDLGKVYADKLSVVLIDAENALQLYTIPTKEIFADRMEVVSTEFSFVIYGYEEQLNEVFADMLEVVELEFDLVGYKQHINSPEEVYASEFSMVTMYIEGPGRVNYTDRPKEVFCHDLSLISITIE